MFEDNAIDVGVDNNDDEDEREQRVGAYLDGQFPNLVPVEGALLYWPEGDQHYPWTQGCSCCHAPRHRRCYDNNTL